MPDGEDRGVSRRTRRGEEIFARIEAEAEAEAECDVEAGMSSGSRAERGGGNE